MRSPVWPIVALCMFSGCGLFMIGDPVEKRDIESLDNGEENLKAVRAMLTDQAMRSAPSPGNSSDTSRVSIPANESNDAQVILSPAISSSPSSAANVEAPAKLPWTPPSVSRPGPPDRSVPAYTVPAPVGPDYSGTIRCAPDGMGGQRCRAQ
jgi:hypothetical protein